MRTGYPAALIVASVASLLLIDPQLSALFFLFPLLVLVPLVLPVTILMWSVVPAYLARRTRAGLPLLALGLGLPLGLALWIPRHVDALAGQDLAALGNITPQRLTHPGPLGVELRRPLNPGGAFVTLTDRQPIDAALCPELCERLLLGGDVLWVRVVIPDDRMDFQTVETRVLFDRGTGAECLALTGRSDPGACILPRRDHGQPADLTLSVTTLSPKAEAGLYQPKGVTLVEGFTADGTAVLRLAQITHDRPTGIPVPSNGGGLALLRTRTTSPLIDLDRVISALGPRLAAPLPRAQRPPVWVRGGFHPLPPDPQDTAYVAALLALGPQQGRADFSVAFYQTIDTWLRRLEEAGPLTDIEARTVCAALPDTRFHAALRARSVSSGRESLCPNP